MKELVVLNKINGVKDLKTLNIDELNLLSSEIREVLLKRMSEVGGHLGPNLGVIELTIALHYVFNAPIDKIIFDVSHQCYTHKILTGRKEAFIDKEKYSTVTGFFNPKESEYDLFKLGHTSSSISLALGISKARDLNLENYRVIDVIGDGSLSGGEALEALNNIYELKSNFILVVNDNDMSIAENHGGLYQSLKDLRDSKGESSNNIFKSFGLNYLYIENGNDIKTLIDAFNRIKDNDSPIVVHIKTKKGNGYEPAMNNEEGFHYRAPFNLEDGSLKNINNDENYSEITYGFLSKKMDEDKSVIAITSAVPYISGFNKERREKYKNQFVDVGISESHAVGFLSGLAKGNAKAFYPVTASFLQRSFDQLIEDLSLNNVNPTLIIFGSGIFGAKDATHLGIFDESLLTNIPNLIYLDPTTYEEYVAMLEYGYSHKNHPLAIRMPIKVIHENKTDLTDYSIINKSKIEKLGSKVCILALGNLNYLGKEVVEELKKHNIDATLIRPTFLNDVDKDLLNKLCDNHDLFITLEDSIVSGGYGEKVSSFLGNKDVRVLNYGPKKEFLDKFDIDNLLIELRLKKELIVKDILKFYI